MAGDWCVLLVASERRREQVIVTMLVTHVSFCLPDFRSSPERFQFARGADGNTPVFIEMDHRVYWENSETLILTLVYKKEIELGLVRTLRGHPLGEV